MRLLILILLYIQDYVNIQNVLSKREIVRFQQFLVLEDMQNAKSIFIYLFKGVVPF